jgi:hypothetical protein
MVSHEKSGAKPAPPPEDDYTITRPSDACDRMSTITHPADASELGDDGGVGSEASMFIKNTFGLPEEKQHHRVDEQNNKDTGAEPSFPKGTWLVKETSKTRWDLLIMLCILYSSVVVPIRICFRADAEGGLWVLEASMSILFLCDLMLNFNVAYIEEGEWVTSRAVITQRYLSRWFWIDAPSSIPVELIELGLQDSKTHALAAFRVLRIVRVLRVVKLLNVGYYISSDALDPTLRH